MTRIFPRVVLRKFRRVGFAVRDGFLHRLNRDAVLGGDLFDGHGVLACVPAVEDSGSDSRALDEELLVR